MLSQEGPAQQITGTAIDAAGNQAMASLTVGVDRTAPIVSVTGPTNWQTTSASQIALTGTVSDALSGLGNAKCNGVAAAIVEGAVDCAVDLRPGRNTVVLQARDVAGNSASAGVTIFRVGTATTLALSPTNRTLLVNETTALTLRDEFGVQILGALWTSSDPAIVSVSTDDPPVLTALSAGTAVISAAKNGLMADASLTAVAGTSLAAGTTRWALTSAPELLLTSIQANRVHLAVPSLFAIDYDGTTSQVRAVSNSGEVEWVAAAPDYPIMADSSGALVAGMDPQGYDADFAPLMSSGSEHDFFPAYRGYARFAGPESVMPWRFDSIGVVARPAQAADGTIYAVERYDTGLTNPNPYSSKIIDTQIVVLDGATGTVRKRIPLARERHQSPCVNGRQTVPQIEGPIVGTDGYAYLVVRHYTRVYTDPGGPGCSITHITQDMGLTLLRIAPSGATSATNVYSQHCEGPIGSTACDDPPSIYEVFPDGTGGTLVRAYRTTAPGEQEMRLTRITDQGIQYDVAVDFDERIFLIGDAGTAFVGGDAVSAKDVTNWTAKWTNVNLSGNPVAALPNGALAWHDSASAKLVELDADGNAVQSAALNSFGYQNEFGEWTLNRAGQVSAQVSLALNEASTSFRSFGGGRTSQNAVERPFRQSTPDEAAAVALDFIFDESRDAGLEVGGRICQYGAQFSRGLIEFGQADRFTFDPAQEVCPDGGMTVGIFHTHWQEYDSAKMPSGYRNFLEYHDPGGSDLKTADTYPALRFYLKTHNLPDSPTHILRFQGPDSKTNIWQRQSQGSWIQLPNAPWQ